MTEPTATEEERSIAWARFALNLGPFSDIMDAPTIARSILALAAERDALRAERADIDRAVQALGISLRNADARADRAEAALRRVREMLTIPAAEYVPAIADVFQVIAEVAP